MTTALNALTDLIRSKIEELGYELVHLEHEGSILRLFIDQLQGVSLEDCSKVSQNLDPVLDASHLVQTLFKDKSYTLEVSSPGIHRPLRSEKDYLRFLGQRIKVQIFRPLTSEESENTEFFKKYPKVKLLVGKLKAYEKNKATLEVALSEKKRNPLSFTLKIPVNLIAKANLEPEIESKFERSA